MHCAWCDQRAEFCARHPAPRQGEPQGNSEAARERATAAIDLPEFCARHPAPRQGGPQGNSEAARERATAALEHPSADSPLICRARGRWFADCQRGALTVSAARLLSAAGAAPSPSRKKPHMLMTSSSLVEVVPN